MFLATKFVSSRGCNSGSIQSFDSDVAILVLYYAPILSKPLYTKIGAGKNERILNVTEAPFQKNFLRALPGLHIFSGCDSTSAFHRIGKRKWLNIVKGNEEYCNALGLLGESLQIEDPLFDMIESIVCRAYGFLNKSNINDVRYEKCCGKKFPEPSKIPPTKEHLHQHVRRVNYQAFLWKNALEANQEIPDADQHGWDAVDGTYKVHWMDNQTAPDEILELVVCDFKKGKYTEQCRCVLLQIPCTDIWKCKGECQNVQNCFLYLMTNLNNKKHAHAHTHTHVCIYTYIYIIIKNKHIFVIFSVMTKTIIGPFKISAS